jgi:hypothetical protein
VEVSWRRALSGAAPGYDSARGQGSCLCWDVHLVYLVYSIGSGTTGRLVLTVHFCQLSVTKLDEEMAVDFAQTQLWKQGSVSGVYRKEAPLWPL